MLGEVCAVDQEQHSAGLLQQRGDSAAMYNSTIIHDLSAEDSPRPQGEPRPAARERTRAYVYAPENRQRLLSQLFPLHW